MHSSSWCVHLITRVFQMFQSRGFMSQAKGRWQKHRCFIRGELTLWFVHEPQGSERSSSFSTLSLSNFEFIFHTPVFFPSHLCPPTIQKVGLSGAPPAPDDELECSEMSRKDTLFDVEMLIRFIPYHLTQILKSFFAQIDLNPTSVHTRCPAFVVPHHLRTTLTLPKRTHPVCSRKHCNPSPCLLLQHTAQDRHRLPARLKGGTQKVVRQGETRQMRRRAHLCRTQEVL